MLQHHLLLMVDIYDVLFIPIVSILYMLVVYCQQFNREYWWDVVNNGTINEHNNYPAKRTGSYIAVY